MISTELWRVFLLFYLFIYFCWLSTVWKCGVKNVSLVESNPLLDLTWKLSTAATPKNSIVAFLCRIVGLCVFLFTEFWYSCCIYDIWVRLTEAFHIHPVLDYYSTMEFGTVVDTFGISRLLLSCLLLFLLLFRSTSRGHCCWKIEEGLYLTVTVSHICQSCNLNL